MRPLLINNDVFLQLAGGEDARDDSGHVRSVLASSSGCYSALRIQEQTGNGT